MPNPFDEIDQVNERIGRWVVAIAAAVALTAVLFWMGRAGAHGESAWIGETNQVNKNGQSCCGELDCHVIPDSDVAIVPNGYIATYMGEQYPVPQNETLPSRDGKFHLCIWGSPPERKCFFIPPMGS